MNFRKEPIPMDAISADMLLKLLSSKGFAHETLYQSETGNVSTPWFVIKTATDDPSLMVQRDAKNRILALFCRLLDINQYDCVWSSMVPIPAYEQWLRVSTRRPYVQLVAYSAGNIYEGDPVWQRS